MSDREKLILDNMKLVYKLISVYYPTYKSDEDVRQEGMVGLIKAVDTYDKSKSKFSTYASRCILNEIGSYFRQELKQPIAMSLDYSVLDENGTEMSIHDIIMGDEDVSSLNVDFELFYKELTPTEKRVWGLLLLYSTRDISEMLGLTEDNVRHVKSRIRKKWRKFNGENTYQISR